jgi:hypothetical protein
MSCKSSDRDDLRTSQIIICPGLLGPHKAFAPPLDPSFQPINFNSHLLKRSAALPPLPPPLTHFLDPSHNASLAVQHSSRFLVLALSNHRLNCFPLPGVIASPRAPRPHCRREFSYVQHNPYGRQRRYRNYRCSLYAERLLYTSDDVAHYLLSATSRTLCPLLANKRDSHFTTLRKDKQ